MDEPWRAIERGSTLSQRYRIVRWASAPRLPAQRRARREDVGLAAAELLKAGTGNREAAKRFLVSRMSANRGGAGRVGTTICVCSAVDSFPVLRPRLWILLCIPIWR